MPQKITQQRYLLNVTISGGDGNWTIITQNDIAICLDTPEQTGSLTYNGTEQSPAWLNYSSEQMKIGGTTAATEAGTYTATFTPQKRYAWTDGTSDAKQVTWTITKAALNLSATISGAVGYGSTGTITVSGNNGNGTVTATSSDDNILAVQSTSANSVTVEAVSVSNEDTTITINVAETTNYLAGSTTCSVSTEKASLSVPIVTNIGFEYDGESHAPTVGTYNNSFITATNTAQINAGNYEVVLALNNPTICQWSDGTTANKTVAWTIDKATCVMTLSEASGTVGTGETITVTVTTPSDGALSVTSSDTSVATATISGNTITITGVSAASATITVSQAAGTNYNAPTSQTYSVTVEFVVSSTLDNVSWATISAVAQAGNADTYWDIGDMKAVTLNGKVGDYLTLDNTTLNVFILHFNYPMNGTPDNNIIFGGFKTVDGVDVALVDSKYGTESTGGDICFSMNHHGQYTNSDGDGYYGANYGGWKGTDLRYDILGATSQAPSEYNQLKTASNVGYDATAATLTNPKADTLLAALSSDFRNALRLWSRWVDAKGGNSNVDANIEETIDAVTLLAEFEVQGERKYATNQYEQNHQAQMEYYRLGNNKIKYRHDLTWQGAYVFYSSAFAFTDFCNSNNANGNASVSHAYSAYGIAPAFLT